MIFGLLLRYFDCSLEFVLFSVVTLAFQLFTRKLCLHFSGLRMRNFTWNRFPIKNFWSIPRIHPRIHLLWNKSQGKTYWHVPERCTCL